MTHTRFYHYLGHRSCVMQKDSAERIGRYIIKPAEAARTSFPSPNCAFSPSLELTTDVPVCPPFRPFPTPLTLWTCAASPVVLVFLAKLARSPALNPCSSSIDIAYVFTVFLTSASPACPRAQHTTVNNFHPAAAAAAAAAATAATNTNATCACTCACACACHVLLIMLLLLCCCRCWPCAKEYAIPHKLHGAMHGAMH